MIKFSKIPALSMFCGLLFQLVCGQSSIAGDKAAPLVIGDTFTRLADQSPTTG